MKLTITKPKAIEYVKAVVYGPGGVGKTVLLSTCMQDERTSPGLLVDFESGDSSIVGSGMDVAHIRDWQDFTDLYRHLLKTEHGYKFIGVDNLSALHFRALVEQMGGGELPNGPLPDKTTYQMFNGALLQMEQFLMRFRDLPKVHVFFTAWSKTEDDPTEGSVKLPMLYGQLAEKIVGLFDGAFYLGLIPRKGDDLKAAQAAGITDLDRVLILKNTKGTRAKMRTPLGKKLPDRIGPIKADTPTISLLLNAWDIPMPGKQ